VVDSLDDECRPSHLTNPPPTGCCYNYQRKDGVAVLIFLDLDHLLVAIGVSGRGRGSKFVGVTFEIVDIIDRTFFDTTTTSTTVVSVMVRLKWILFRECILIILIAGQTPWFRELLARDAASQVGLSLFSDEFWSNDGSHVVSR
jgi:hypothetical protein